MADTPSRPAEVVIGLDVGTTATKAVAFGIGSPWRHTVVREYPLLRPAPGWAVQDPDEIVAAAAASLAEVVRRCGDARVVAVSLSSAMHGLIGLDDDLRPLTPLLTWADARAAGEARDLRSIGLAGDLHRLSGTPVHPMSPLTKLMWFSRHEPALVRRTRAWVGLKDHVLHALTGTLATELSSASGTGLLDLRTRDWNPTALDLAGVRPEQLPRVLPTTATLPLAAAAAARAGLPAGTPVVVGAGDGPLGNLGTGALDAGVVGLSVGTSAAVRMVVPRPLLDRSDRLFCYALTDDAWVVGGAVSNGGATVRWAGSVFGATDDGADDGDGTTSDAQLLELAASVAPGSDGLVAIPYLLPERAPLWDPAVTGAFLGVRQGHTRAHFVRALVEGVALQLAAVVDDLDRLKPVTEVRATGGAFRSRLWREVLAGALGRPVTVTGSADGTALGAAALALLATGRAQTLRGGLVQLSPDPSDGSRADGEAGSAVYQRLRSALPELLQSYAGVAALFAEQPERPRVPA
jgi:gluconokinase